MRNLIAFLLLVIVGFAFAVNAGDLKLCSFNVQVFGNTKMAKPEVVQTLLRILSRYDVIFFQEIRDSTGNAIVDLLNKLNAYGSIKYDIVISDRLGRTNSKEQYAYIYNVDKVSVVAHYQYPQELDQYERAPFSVVMKPKGDKNNARAVFLTGVHTSPSKAGPEIDRLVDVYNSYLSTPYRDILANRWITMGDFNAGCSYVSPTAMSKLRLRSDTTFKWLIADNVKTTTKSDCPYDRFVVSNKKAGGVADQIKNVRPFYYDKEWNIATKLLTDVSDHYPIELTIANWN
ncbi:hypothetical protein ABK040_002319 [Willaertia magna]